MGKRHVVPAEPGWCVIKEGAAQASATTETQDQAITGARQIIANEGGGELVIRAKDAGKAVRWRLAHGLVALIHHRLRAGVHAPPGMAM